MSFLTALSLSLNNLMTKKGRTMLTSFAGSIGIIGIALILSLSNGVQKYIEKVQEDTLSSYFDSKEIITDEIEKYNQKQKDEGKEENVINYTDMIGIMMKSVSVIVNMISYVLIAFVAISLVVSSIMIGIITYISVLERTKEIGILRAIGASKKDISRVFNAETFIVGLIAGLLGIGVTVILTIPINGIIKDIANVSGIASLPIGGAIILVLISMILTMIAGLIPSKMASKKDPVEALRTEYKNKNLFNREDNLLNRFFI